MSLLRKLGIALLIALVGCTVVLFCLRKHPVLVRLEGTVDWEWDHAHDILNPFCDRSPEKPAAAFLKQVQEGHCIDVIRTLGAFADTRCAEDTEFHHILSWQVRARNDTSPTDVMLLYQGDFGNHKVNTDPYWFRVKKQDDGTRKVVQLYSLVLTFGGWRSLSFRKDLGWRVV